MPIISDKKQLSNLKETQKFCLLCNEGGGRSERCTIITCDICSHWVCKDCSGMDTKLYDFITSNNTDINFICSNCKGQLPKIKDLLAIEQKQAEMESDIIQMKQDIQENKQSINQIKNMSERMEKVEKILKANKMEDEQFPPLLGYSEAAKKMQEDISKTKETAKQLNLNIEEEKRREIRKANLIVYGLPEHESTAVNQMKSDFHSLQELYSETVDLNASDFSNITRLGKKKEGQIGPIRFTFYDNQLRKEALINNKGLRYEGHQYDQCNCKTNPGRHIHINVTTDKTKQEREEENKLREMLLERRRNGEDVTIRRGKIVKTDQQESQARWAVISQDV